MNKLIFCDYGLDNKQVFYKDENVVGGHTKRIDICVEPNDLERFKKLDYKSAKRIIDNVLNDIVVVLKS